jgi:hypothetical protein
MTIAVEKQYFTREGKPFFYLADTVWNVFANAPIEEWKEYLAYRKWQQFNVLQFSMLPILHDNSELNDPVMPFYISPNGEWDFYRIHEGYFDKAEEMIRLACEAGFIPNLTLLWCSFVPGTWLRNPDPSIIMPLEAVAPYVQYVAKRFAKYDPIYMISGDTDFSEEANVYYSHAALALKEVSPNSTTTLHTRTSEQWPDRFIQMKELDFYVYQSGHLLQDIQLPFKLAERYAKEPVERPILNSEPCYEGAGHGMQYGRFDAFSLRRAFWQSVLSGASAGFTYGAHGIWSWHARGAAFNNEVWSKTPLDWRRALELQGAWDVSFAKTIVEQKGLYAAIPAQELLLTLYEDIRVAATPDRNCIAVYVPFTTSVKLQGDLSQYHCYWIEFQNRNIMPASSQTSFNEQEGVHTVFEMYPFNTDALLILEKACLELI